MAVTILDVNDNLPVFDPHSYSANVSEAEEVGEAVLTVSVTDKDEVSFAIMF